MAMQSTRHFTATVHGGYVIWTANTREVDADNVAEVVLQYQNAGTLTIYSGVHGDIAGRFDYPERSFAYEDRVGLPANVRVFDISRNSIDINTTIANAATDILFAWCFSNSAVAGKSPYR